ncbi:MAG: hypothetical protein LAT67_04515 [Balneolales bacterium]|nr:hypothetical protein [Balneolales bacterium]
MSDVSCQLSAVRINDKFDTNKSIRFLSGRLFLIARDFQNVDKHLNTKHARMDLPSFGNALTEAPKGWSRARNLAILVKTRGQLSELMINSTQIKASDS